MTTASVLDPTTYVENSRLFAASGMKFDNGGACSLREDGPSRVRFAGAPKRWHRKMANRDIWR
jgi:hypothetical protein